MIDLTDRAITHIMKNLRAEGEYIRIGLKPAGCTGFEYIIDWDKLTEDDIIIDFGKFGVIIDINSQPMLDGSTIDVIEDGINTNVKVINPKELNQCGCGASVNFE